MKLRTILSLLAVVSILQLGLLWIQGAQLYRQQETLQALRTDIQDLAEVIDSITPQGGEEEQWSPSGHPTRRGHLRPASFQEEDAAKELKAAQESAQKAVKDARDAQKKLSITEAAKRAEEKEKVKAAESEWLRWVWIALAVVALSLVLRAWLRRR